MSSRDGIPNSAEWRGDDWQVEVEPNCFEEADGLVVSLFIKHLDDGEAGLATLTPAQAREVAEVLVVCADYVDQAGA